MKKFIIDGNSITIDSLLDDLKREGIIKNPNQVKSKLASILFGDLGNPDAVCLP